MSYISNKDFLLEVAKGNIEGHQIFKVPGLIAIPVSQNAYDDLTPIPSITKLSSPGGVQLEVHSSNTNDKPGSSGVQTLKLHYLDSNYDYQSEIITMNGTNSVSTVATDIQEIWWISTETVGSNGVSRGDIELREVGDGTIYEYIEEGGNQSLSARFTIPNGYKGYLIDWHCSGMKARIDFQLRATCDRYTRELKPGVFLFQDTESCEKSNSGQLDGKGLEFPERCTVKISALASTSGGEAAAGFTIMLVKQ
jgi:hypothetical protein